MPLFHPAACLLVWLAFAVAVQFFDWPALAVGSVCLLAAGKAVIRRFLKLLWRAKWLLITLSVVMAYGTPGDLWHGLSWAPSWEGMDAAGLHTLRLILLLWGLAWLFEQLPHHRFIAGLWTLVRPFRFLHLDANRTVARLALVFDYLEHAPPKGSWRHFLELPEEDGEHQVLRLEIPYWKPRDVWGMAAIMAGLAALVLLP